MYIISLNLKSFDLDYLNRVKNYLYSMFSFFNLRNLKHKMNLTKSKKITVLRSPHIDKKSREQFQIVTYKRTIVLTIDDKHIVLLLLNLLKTIKLPGIELEILLEFSRFFSETIQD
jgi:ribosomal protein S10